MCRFSDDAKVVPVWSHRYAPEAACALTHFPGFRITTYGSLDPNLTSVDLSATAVFSGFVLALQSALLAGAQCASGKITSK